MEEQKPLEETYSPPPMGPTDPELQKKKRRRRIIIIISIVFGSIIILALIAIGIIYAIGQSISAICQNACSSCTCDCGCDEACSNACNNACSSSCSNCGSSSINSVHQVGDPSLDTKTFFQYLWETLKDWFFNLFS